MIAPPGEVPPPKPGRPGGQVPLRMRPWAISYGKKRGDLERRSLRPRTALSAAPHPLLWRLSVHVPAMTPMAVVPIVPATPIAEAERTIGWIAIPIGWIAVSVGGITVSVGGITVSVRGITVSVRGRVGGCCDTAEQNDTGCQQKRCRNPHRDLRR